MGGFANSIAHAAGEFVENSTSTISKMFGKTAAIDSEHVEAGIYRTVFDPKKSFEEHPYAAKIYKDYENEYKPRVSKYTSQNITALQAKTNVNQQTLISDATKAAHKKATAEVFGPNRIRIQAMLKSVESTQGKNKADVLADHLNILFEEQPAKTGPSRMSQFDKDMRSSKNVDEGFETPTSKYRNRNSYERSAGVFRRTLAYKAAILHAANTGMNMLTEDGFIQTAKTMRDVWGPSKNGAIAAIQSSNMISELVVNPLKEQIAFDAGVIHKFAPGTVGAFIHENMYIPGLPAVRKQGLLIGAQSGKLMAEEAAAHLEAGNNKWALPALRSLGLDAQKIKNQGYKLLQDDIDKTYYHGANNKVFLDPYDATPTFWRQSPLWRSMKAFTGFVTKQGQFERRVMMKQYEQGDYKGLIRNLTLKAMVWPVLGSTIYETERLLTGDDWDDPKQHLENRLEATPAGAIYDKLTGHNRTVSAVQTVENTIDMLGRLGAWGSTTGYVRSMNRASLGSHILPPESNVIKQFIEDGDKATHRDINHPHAAEPLERDAVSLIPFVGGPLSHKLLPTRAEKNAGKYKRYKRSKLKPDSMNPLNYPDFKY